MNFIFILPKLKEGNFDITVRVLTYFICTCDPLAGSNGKSSERKKSIRNAKIKKLKLDVVYCNLSIDGVGSFDRNSVWRKLCSKEASLARFADMLVYSVYLVRWRY